MSKEIISTKNAPQAIGPYSQAVKIGNLIFISGQIPLNPETGDLVSGIKIESEKFISETLITHKSLGIKKVIKKIIRKWLMS